MLATTGRVPGLNELVSAPGDEQLAVGTERDARHACRVSLQSPQFLACCRIPKLDGVISAGGGQQAIIWTKGNRSNWAGMAAKSRLFALVQPPQVMPLKAAQVLLLGVFWNDAPQQLHV